MYRCVFKKLLKNTVIGNLWIWKNQLNLSWVFVILDWNWSQHMIIWLHFKDTLFSRFLLRCSCLSLCTWNHVCLIRFLSFPLPKSKNSYFIGPTKLHTASIPKNFASSTLKIQKVVLQFNLLIPLSWVLVSFFLQKLQISHMGV